MRFYHLTLFLFPALLFILFGCNQNQSGGGKPPQPPSLPIPGGSLIPPDEIPRITIEKTRQDDEFYYWQLKAEPAPIHEDLVVGVAIYPGLVSKQVKVTNLELIKVVSYLSYLSNNYDGVSPIRPFYEERKLKDQEITLDTNNMAYDLHSPIYLNSVTSSVPDAVVNRQSTSRPIKLSITVVILKGQNTSREFRLPLSYVVEEHTLSNFLTLENKLEEFKNKKSESAHYVQIKCQIAENVTMDRTYELDVMDFLDTVKLIARDGFVPIADPFDVEDAYRPPSTQMQFSDGSRFPPDDEEAKDIAPRIFAILDMPLFQTFDFYIIREGFSLSYYSSVFQTVVSNDPLRFSDAPLVLKPPPDPE